MAEKSEKIKSEAATREERILEFWKRNDIFQKSLVGTQGKKEFVFYEGPPTANGKPGIHHLEARSFKDAIPRYKTMRGYHVRRKAGWDTHGLPVELEVEKELGLKSKKEIESYGIEAFNKKCKESTWKYLDLWNTFTERIGYWLDQKNPYITYDKKYMESLWNVVKTIDDKKLLYKDYKVLPWCPRCGTALSSHELAQGYQDVKDLSVYVKFKVLGKENTYFIAWTTTPWTLPGNVALAVGKDIRYIKIKPKDSEEIYILAKDLLLKLFPEFNGAELGYLNSNDLVGMQYEPLYPFMETLDKGDEQLKNAYKVYPADFVNTTEGTGIVHTAVMYGQDDFVLGSKVGLPKYHLVDDSGHFVKGTGFLEGKFVRDEETAVEIIKDLAHRGLLFKKEKYAHSYPHCWRCKTPLIYYARDSWYIKMSSLRDELVSENKKINWEPEHIEQGRFGEWLREVKDWAFSRERYWGTPLPVWICEDCGERHVIGSVADLKEKTKKSGNKYFVMRHGEADHNLLGMASADPHEPVHLTAKGEEQAREQIEKLKKEKIDLIISSPFVRTRETSEVIREGIGLAKESVLFDERLREMDIGKYNKGKWADFHRDFPKTAENFDEAPEGGESYQTVKNWMMNFLHDVEIKFKNKKILIVTHGGPAWLSLAGANGFDAEESLSMIRDKEGFHYFNNAEVKEIPFMPFPHNTRWELDLHRPFIDEIKIVCKCGGQTNRVKEVIDVWFDSGSMPFAQDHYPFENKEWVEGAGYPADYISEAIDQTRGWFYTLLAVGVLMGRGTPYKNVICLGHILDAEGKKMSKSIGNIVDPWAMIEKYGVDTLRLWMYSVNQPGESKNFDERTVLELHRQVFGLLYNVLAFYELYPHPHPASPLAKGEVPKAEGVLDIWILARLNELTKTCTENLDNYKLLEPVRAIKDFINDLSTWYLRRSRERIKEGDKDARATLYFVLKNLAKLMAPFAPFAADDIWLRLKNEKDVESIHLARWLEAHEVNSEVLEKMEQVRKIVSLGLEARQKVGIKVRQPLNELKLKGEKLGEEYLDLIKDEVNVKKVIFDEKMEADVDLDVEITPELKEEGDYRELVRSIQDMRKKQGLTPSNVITLTIQTDEAGQKIIEKFEVDLKKTVLVSSIKFSANDGEEIKIDKLLFKVQF
jgi:isoleucyl-tRNA synthetase